MSLFTVMIATIRPPEMTERAINRVRETLTHPTDLLILNGNNSKSAALNPWYDKIESEYCVTMDDDLLLPPGWQDDVIEALELGRLGAVGLDLAHTEKGRSIMIEVNELERYGNIEIRPMNVANVAGIFMAMTTTLARAIGKHPVKEMRRRLFSGEDYWRCCRVRELKFKIGYVKCRGGDPEMLWYPDPPDWIEQKKREYDDFIKEMKQGE